MSFWETYQLNPVDIEKLRTLANALETRQFTEYSFLTEMRSSYNELRAYLEESFPSDMMEFLGNRNVPVRLIQGEVFDKSISLKQSLLHPDIAKLQAQEILPLAIAVLTGELFGIAGERNNKITQTGIKNAKGGWQPRSVNGTGSRGPHQDNPHDESVFANQLVFGLTCPNGVNTSFGAVKTTRLVTLEILDTLRENIFETGAVLDELKKDPRKHSVVTGNCDDWAKLILNETTTSTNQKGQKALKTLRKYLTSSGINKPFSFAAVNNRVATHWIKAIPENKQFAVCARSEDQPDTHRGLTRIYCR